MRFLTIIALLLLSGILTPGQTLQAITNDVHHGNNLGFVQACKAIDGGTTTSHAINIGSSGACSASINPVVGDLVTVQIGYRAAPTSQSCADTAGNSWTSVVNSANRFGYCWSIITTGGASTLTFTSGSSVDGVMISLEFSGAAASPLDAAATTSSLGSGLTSWNGASYTSANANDVIIGCGSAFLNGTYTQGTGYTIPTDGQIANSIPYSGYCEYRIVIATGTFTPPATPSASANNVFTLSVGFKSS